MMKRMLLVLIVALAGGLVVSGVVFLVARRSNPVVVTPDQAVNAAANTAVIPSDGVAPDWQRDFKTTFDRSSAQAQQCLRTALGTRFDAFYQNQTTPTAQEFGQLVPCLE